jgi:hypothetical protein
VTITPAAHRNCRARQIPRSWERRIRGRSRPVDDRAPSTRVRRPSRPDRPRSRAQGSTDRHCCGA